MFYFQCPDKPNVTKSIVCSTCGGSGHIARDCRTKRPGAPQTTGTESRKIDQEVSKKLVLHEY